MTSSGTRLILDHGSRGKLEKTGNTSRRFYVGWKKQTNEIFHILKMVSKITAPQQFYIVLPFFIHWKLHKDHSKSELVKHAPWIQLLWKWKLHPRCFLKSLEFLQKLLVAKKKHGHLQRIIFFRAYEAMPNFFCGSQVFDLFFFVFGGK